MGITGTEPIRPPRHRTGNTPAPLTTAQIDRITDYKRCTIDQLAVARFTGLASGARSIGIDGEQIGWLTTNGLVILDRPRGYVTIEPDGRIAFRDGRYYCV